MKNFELVSFATAAELARTVAGKWMDEIEVAKHTGQPYCVALSGGRIAQKFFAEIVEQAKTRKVGDGGTPSLPDNVHFFWADERCVPPDDPESNFRLAKELLFAPLKISESQIHRVRGELPPENAAAQATAEILRIVPTTSPSPHRGEGRPSSVAVLRRVEDEEAVFLNSIPLAPALSPLGRGEGVQSLPVLDLIFLGVGEDGHVASLFPDGIETAGADNAVYRAVKNSPKPPPNRITLGYATIAAARQVWVLVSGASKEAALRKTFYGEGKTPLGRVTQFRTQTRIFIDFPLN